MWETWILSLGWEDPLEKGMAAHFSILACRIPWTVSYSPCGHRAGHDWATFTFTFSCPEGPINNGLHLWVSWKNEMAKASWSNTCFKLMIQHLFLYLKYKYLGLNKYKTFVIPTYFRHVVYWWVYGFILQSAIKLATNLEGAKVNGELRVLC